MVVQVAAVLAAQVKAQQETRITVGTVVLV
jgi:hypothetical protein